MAQSITLLTFFIYVLQIFSGTLCLPEGFVYLSDIDPTIRSFISFYDTRNLVGQRIDGYKAPKVILTEKAALALKNVQDDIRKDGYSLLIDDAYRPTKAVDHIYRWSKDINDQKMKKFFYPNIDKRDVFKLGYVAKRSGHSRGSSVDLMIIEIGKTFNANPPAIKRNLTNGQSIYYWDDNTVDMYTSAGLLDLASWHDTDLVEPVYTKNVS